MMSPMRVLWSVVLALVLAAPAAAQTATMEPTSIHVGKTDKVTFFLQLGPGNWTVVADMPAFVTGHRAFGSLDPLDPFGSPLTPAGPPVVPAGATVSGGGPGTAGLPNVCRRGFDAPADPLTQITMPAAGGTVAWGFWVSQAQRWSTTDYRVTFRLRGPSGSAVSVRPAPPTVRGPLGTRFRLRLRKSGSAFVATGSTQPALRRGRVSLMTAAARDDASEVPVFPGEFTRRRAVSTVRTDSAGRFRFRWRPARDRYYAVWAASFSERGRLGDSSCPLRIDTGS
jgi:hypothetical protein